MNAYVLGLSEERTEPNRNTELDITCYSKTADAETRVNSSRMRHL